MVSPAEEPSTPGTDASRDRERRRQRVLRAIEAAQAGRDVDGSFRILHDAYFRPLQRFFLRKGFGTEDALDLTQEAFLGIYRGLGTYRYEARFEAWLYQVANRVYLKRLRKGSTLKRSGHEISREDLDAPEASLAMVDDQLDAMLEKERREAMREAVDELPERMRKCLTLRIDQQLSYAEIAVLMKLKIDTVKAHLFQARQRLKQKLSGFVIEGLDG